MTQGFKKYSAISYRQRVVAIAITAVAAIGGTASMLVTHAATTINGHTVATDSGGKLVSWVTPQSDAYAQSATLAWNYLLTSVPNDPSTGKPAYLSRSYIDPDTQGMAGWPHNPAGLYGMMIESALSYYAYSGNASVLQVAQTVANAQLANGMTASSDNWSSVPYSSGDGGSLTYKGASYGNSTGVGDGVGVLQPDKIGELGFSLLKLYEQTGNVTYRDAAINAGNALASHVRAGSASQSPWPYRVVAASGAVKEQYTANVIGPISLLDELVRLGLGNTANYQAARTTAWSWMMQYPVQNNVWTQYFEDVPIQGDYSDNRNQYDAMMVARYLLQHPEFDASWEAHARSIITWVEQNFNQVDQGANTIKEQFAFAHPMGSHTSRYASVLALFYEKTGDANAKEKAYRSFNWATYMARSNGRVIDGPEVNNQWFTDGYGDYIRHFMVGMGAVPEWAPTTQNHLLRSSSTVKSITYSAQSIAYSVFDGSASDVLRLTAAPSSVTVNGTALVQRTDLNQPGWTYSNNVLRIYHATGTSVQVGLNGAPANQPPTVTLTEPASGTQLAAPATIGLAASAGDSDGTISKVEFYNGTTLLGADTTSPYSYSWTNVSTGNYSLKAVATDSSGAATTSSTIGVTVVAAADTTPPVISSVSVTGANQNGATVQWVTNEASNSKVDYGLTSSYGLSTALNNSLVTSHTMVVAGLNAATTYHYRVRSIDAAGNSSVSGDFTFTTTGSAVAGDLDNNGVVNLSDLSRLLSKWQSTDTTADLNKNGIVDLADLSMLLSHWNG